MTTLILLPVLLLACAPDYPNDDDHQDATAAACTSCHVDGTDADAPEPSDAHFEDDDSLADDRVECTSCHAIEE